MGTPNIFISKEANSDLNQFSKPISLQASSKK